MKTIMRIMPFLLLIGIIVFVLVLKGIEDESKNERENRKNTLVITKESTKIAESAPVAGKWKKREYESVDQSIRSLVEELEPGVFQFEDDLILIKPESDKAYEVIRREVEFHEVRLIVRLLSSERNGEIVVGEMSINKEVPIGVYDENGEYLF